MQKKFYYMGFSLFPGIGPVRFDKLLHIYGDVVATWHADKKTLVTVLGEGTADAFISFRDRIDLRSAYTKLTQQRILLVTKEDSFYPFHLRQLPHAPFLLYVKGDPEVLVHKKIIGVVGTRKITPYGIRVTELLTRELVQQGFVIASGLAFGVDALAHTTTLQNNGATIAVLGCGVDCCTPSSNQRIYDEIINKGGAIISTMPVGMQATKGSFPMRNKIIAGISLGILVTEGALDSGSLITASYAKEFARPIFAVPGPITSSLSEGVNMLIKQGAIAITSISDILDNLGILGQVKSQQNQVRGETAEEQEILDALQNGPLLFDEIVRKIRRDSTYIGSLLSLMELKGLIKSGPDGRYFL